MENCSFENCCLELFGVFKGRFNVLFVDDNQDILDSIPNLFTSPLISMQTASSKKQAIEKISKTPQWHCWILDISLEEDDSGLKFLTLYPHFPFVVILSGMRSMTVASNAISMGALKVFDKNPVMFESFISDICKISALGYILSGKTSKYFDLFYLLCTNNFSNTEEWAEKACITSRQLERICADHSLLTPRLIVPFYNSIAYLLSVDRVMLKDHAIEPDEHTQSAINFVWKNIDKFV